MPDPNASAARFERIEATLERIDARIEAITHSVELLSLMQQASERKIDRLAEAQLKTEQLMAHTIEAINSLARIAQSHQDRLDKLEGQ